MADMNVSLKIVGDSASASEAVAELDKEIKNLGRSSSDASSSLEKTEDQVDDVSESIEEATGKTQELIDKTSDLEKLGDAFKRIGGDISSLGTSLTVITAPITAIAALGIKNILDLGQSETLTGPYKEFATVVTNLKDNFTELSVEVGTIVMPVVQNIAAIMSNAINAFRSMDEETKKLVVTIGIAVAALGPLLVIVGKSASVFGTLLKVIAVIGPMFGKILLAINPIATVLASVGMVVVGLINTFRKLKDSGETTFEALRLSGALFVDGFNNYVTRNILRAINLLLEGFEGLASIVSSSMSESIRNAKESVSGIVESYAKEFENTKGVIDAKLKPIGSSAASAMTLGFTDGIKGLKDSFTSIFSGNIDMEPVKKPFKELKEETEKADEELKKARESAEATARAMEGAIVSSATNGFMAMIEGTKSVADAFKDMAKQVLNDLIRIMIQAQITQAIMGAGFTSGAGGIQGFASGGYVHGAGSSTSDSIPARLSNGEFVVRASSVDKVGVGFLNYINSLGSKTSKIKMPNEFANGGVVSSSSSQIGVEIINNGSGKEVTEASYDPKTMVVSVVLEDLNKNGPLAKGLSSTFGIRRGVTR